VRGRDKDSDAHTPGSAAGSAPAPVPSHTPPFSSRAVRRVARFADQVRAALGLRRTIHAGGARYIETNSEPLRRALSRRGSGSKEFIVEFADGYRHLIHCTPHRVYADIMEPRLLPCYEMLLSCLRPGMRALDFGCGTGYGSAWLVDVVGPSGAVVALDRDLESIVYAQRRYAAPNAAFEVGWTNALSGETDGAFDVVVSLDAFREDDDPHAVVRELWRVLRPGGWMLIVTPAPLGPASKNGPGAPRAFEPRELSDLVKRACEDQIRSDAPEGQSPGPIQWDEGSGPDRQAEDDQSAGTAEPVATSAAPDHSGILISKPGR